MNLLGIESSSRKLSVGLMKEGSLSELHSEKKMILQIVYHYYQKK